MNWSEKNDIWNQLETHHPTEYALLQTRAKYFNDFDGLARPGLCWPGLALAGLGQGLGWALASWLGWAGPGLSLGSAWAGLAGSGLGWPGLA